MELTFNRHHRIVTLHSAEEIERAHCASVLASPQGIDPDKLRAEKLPIQLDVWDSLAVIRGLQLTVEHRTSIGPLNPDTAQQDLEELGVKTDLAL